VGVQIAVVVAGEPADRVDQPLGDTLLGQRPDVCHWRQANGGVGGLSAFLRNDGQRY
jgi:hypothetical protein